MNRPKRSKYEAICCTLPDCASKNTLLHQVLGVLEKIADRLSSIEIRNEDSRFKVVKDLSSQVVSYMRALLSLLRDKDHAHDFRSNYERLRGYQSVYGFEALLVKELCWLERAIALIKPKNGEPFDEARHWSIDVQFRFFQTLKCFHEALAASEFVQTGGPKVGL